MSRVVKQAKGLLVLAAVLAFAAAACSNSSTAAPANGDTNAPAKSAKPTLVAPSVGTDTNPVAGDLSSVSSYKFTMTIAGGTLGSSLSMLGGAKASGNAPFTMSGTIVAKPAPAADIQMGSFHIIEINGKDYVDMGTGSFISNPVSGKGMAESFSPSTMFGSFTSSMSQFKKVGTENKNGVSAIHYQGSDALKSELNASVDNTADAWTADFWMAAEGGYPVSMAVVGTKGGTMVAEIIFDISNVNDPGNTVAAPAS